VTRLRFDTIGLQYSLQFGQLQLRLTTVLFVHKKHNDVNATAYDVIVGQSHAFAQPKNRFKYEWNEIGSNRSQISSNIVEITTYATTSYSDKPGKWPYLWHWLSSNLPFSACYFSLSNRRGIQPVKNLGVGLLVVIWLELCTYYSSSRHHHFHHS